MDDASITFDVNATGVERKVLGVDGVRERACMLGRKDYGYVGGV